MVTIRIIYDGDCPFCHRFVQACRLRATASELELIDARERPELVAELARQGHDLDEGLVVEAGEVRAFGADAMHLLALLSSPSTTFNRVNAWLFRNRTVARLAYPVLRTGRRLLLTLLGRPRLRNHQDGHRKE